MRGRSPAEQQDAVLSRYVGAAIALALLLVQAGEVTTLDGTDMLAVAHSLIHHGTLQVPASHGVAGVDGAYYAKYGIGLSVFVIPFVAIGDLFALVLGHQPRFESLMTASTAPLIMGALAMTLWRISRRLGTSGSWATVIAVGAVLGTYALPYGGKDFFSEPLTTLAIVLSINELLAGRDLRAGLALAVAIVTRPESAALLIAFPCVLWAFGGRSRRRTLTFAGTGALGALIDGVYNQYRFGSPVASGYRGEHFSTPFLHGASGLLFSPEKSVLLFAPIVLILIPSAIALWRDHRMFVLLVATNFAAMFAIAAVWHSWEGGWSWGPRLILPAVIPACALLAGAPKELRRIAQGLLGVGFAVSASTLLVPIAAQQLDYPTRTVGPSVIRQYELVPAAVSYSAQHLQAAHVAGAHRRYVDLWQVNLGREFGAKGLLLGLVGSLVILGMLCAVLLRVKHSCNTRRWTK
ncbi:MAG: hypothetical protein JOZ25_09220 [Actinobacteria bacterium]|nr:hypothetical protein [Actinomycetota bacterium]